MTQKLKSGDELHCPQCGEWHPVFAPHGEGTPPTMEMLYWTCRDARYYAGSRGGTARYETRRPDGR